MPRLAQRKTTSKSNPIPTQKGVEGSLLLQNPRIIEINGKNIKGGRKV